MFHGIKRAGIIINHHLIGIDTGANTVEENQMNIVIDNLLKMIKFFGRFRLGS